MNFTGFCGKPPFFRPRGTAGKAQNGKPRQLRDCRGGEPVCFFGVSIRLLKTVIDCIMVQDI